MRNNWMEVEAKAETEHENHNRTNETLLMWNQRKKKPKLVDKFISSTEQISIGIN